VKYERNVRTVTREAFLKLSDGFNALSKAFGTLATVARQLSWRIPVVINGRSDNSNMN
jgi:hypothetical protein